MTHLYIEQNTGLTEEVNSSIISKLYELAISGDLDNTSDLKGRLHSTLGYQNEIDYLNNKYSELHITADQMYIEFEDPIVEKICASKWGDGIGITPSQAAAVNNSSWGKTFENNTEITKFNEFVYFTGLNQSGWLNNIGYFYGCTNLTEVTIPKNIKHIDSQNNGAFTGCTSLVKVNYDPDCVIIQAPRFVKCSSLQSPLVYPNSCASVPEDIIKSSTGGSLQNIHTIVLGSNVTQIKATSNGYGQSYKLDYIIYTVTPPVLMNTWWINNKVTFYVPDEAVNDYKSASNWSTVSSAIKPISKYDGTEWDTSLAANMYGYNPSA